MNSSPIKVVFLTFYFEAWDALADVHSQMLNDDRFDVTVISIPRRFRQEEPFTDEDKVSAFLTEQGVKHERFNFDDSLVGLAKLRELAPDYVFINYPWQRNYQPGYRVEALSEFTKVCYIPYYSLALANEPGEIGVTPYLYTQRSNQLASLVFTQDANTLDAYAKTSRGNGYVHLTGTPKIDALVRKVNEPEPHWPLNNPGNRRMVWAPHHSFSESWFNFGMFPKISGQMLHFAKSNPKVDILMRPHPIMFGNVVASGVRTAEELDLWLKEWNALPNTAIDSEGDIAPLFAAADVFVTDGISFLGEYPLATGKPAIFFENDTHWPWSPIGKIAARANIHVQTFQEFEDVFNDIAEHGLPDFSHEIAALQSAAQPYPGQAAEKIVDVVRHDFEAKTPLVNKALVTEVAWENKPGAEPAWD
jgi:hypothetical protein